LKATFNFNPEGERILRSKKKELNHQTSESGSLDTLPLGLTARVVNVHGSNAISRRLMEMGVVPGAPIRVIRSAPLGDPIQICLRNYHLALRRTEARAISVMVSV
jgi:ferrous iron transport protein A